MRCVRRPCLRVAAVEVLTKAGLSDRVEPWLALRPKDDRQNGERREADEADRNVERDGDEGEAECVEETEDGGFTIGYFPEAKEEDE